MKKIIEEVIRRRILNNPNADVISIQLSPTLMKIFVDQCNKDINGSKIDWNDDQCEVEYKYLDKQFTIKHRAYRDETNDPDVDIVLYELASK